MTRPPTGVSFAQYFPTAPKVQLAEALDRAGRDLSKGSKIRDHPSSHAELATLSPETDANEIYRSAQGSSSLSAPHSRTDDHDSPMADIPSTGGSASSHASSGSSIFSHPPRHLATTSHSRLPANVTPISSRFSPLNPPHSAPSITDTSRSSAHSSQTTQLNGVLSYIPSFAERCPARDPLPSIKGLKCTYDPLLDRLRNKSVNKTSKPIYKEFGLVRTFISLSDNKGRGASFVEGKK